MKKSIARLRVDYKMEIECDDCSEIAVFMPVAPKDYDSVFNSIKSLRTNLLNPISRIVICGQDTTRLRKICSDLDCYFADENLLTPIPKSNISIIVNGVDRSSWIFQQLLKLSVFECLESEFALIWDADTCLIREMCFQSGSQSIIEYMSEPHKPYFASATYLLGGDGLPTFDFGLTCHKLLVDRNHISEMKSRIEKHCGTNWYDAVIRSLDLNEESSFSEYALYSLYMLKYHPQEIVLVHWKNLQMDSQVSGFKQKIMSCWFNSISIHNYSRD